MLLFNAGLWEIQLFCPPSAWEGWIAENNKSKSDIENCAMLYRTNFKRVLDMLQTTFPLDLKIFRTTHAAWMRWGNYGFTWIPCHLEQVTKSPHVVKMFNDIAVEVIRESGYDIKVYDFFWITWSRPDDTEIDSKNEIGRHLGHMGLDTLKASIRKLITMVMDYFGCL